MTSPEKMSALMDLVYKDPFSRVVTTDADGKTSSSYSVTSYAGKTPADLLERLNEAIIGPILQVPQAWAGEQLVLDAEAGQNAGEIRLWWNHLTGVSYYILSRSEYAGGYVPILTTSELEFLDTGLNPGQTYYYTLRAYDSAGVQISGNSAPSLASLGEVRKYAIARLGIFDYLCLDSLAGFWTKIRTNVRGPKGPAGKDSSTTDTTI